MIYSTHPGTTRIRAWRKANPERAAELRQRYREKNREMLRQKQAARAAANREGEVARVQRWISENREKFDAYQVERFGKKADAQEQQAGRPRPDVCEVCEEPNKKAKRLAFDHCHTNGHFRGWLCDGCNLTLGLVRDSPERLRKLAHYLIEDAMRQPFDPSQIES